MTNITMLYIKYIGAVIMALGAIAGILSILLSFCGALSDKGKNDMLNFAYLIIAIGVGCLLFGS